MNYIYPCIFNDFLQNRQTIFQPTYAQNTFQLFPFVISPQIDPKNLVFSELQPIMPSSQTACQFKTSNIEKPTFKKDKIQIRKEVDKKKDGNFGWRNQNKDRNVISNILKSYVQFVLFERGMVKFIQELSKMKQLDNGVSKFYEFITEKFPKRKSYLGVKYFQEILKRFQDSMVYILRSTLAYYLKEVYPISVIQQFKIKKRQRAALLKKSRTILPILFSNP